MPVNPVGSQLYGAGWPICRPVIVVDDESRPLPDMLVREITRSPDVDVDPVIDWHALKEGTPLEIDDHLRHQPSEVDLDEDNGWNLT